MASRRLVPASVREALLGIPSDIASLERNYLLADDDLDLIGTRRRPENRLGLALHIALLRHPGQGWLDDTDPPTPLVAWLAEQIKVPFPALARYGSRGATRSNHRRLAIRHLGLRAFVPAHDMRTAMDVAARAAFDTDDGRIILARVSGAIQAQRFVLPSADTLERIGLAGRARARRLSAQAVNDALDDERKQALNALLAYDPSLGRSRLTWLRTPPQSTSAPSMLALLERLTYVRAVALPRHLGDNIHPARRAQFAREGAVAPVNLLSDFGSRRRIASLAALMLELETTLTDAAIALFERLTGRLFTRSRNSQDRSWSASKTQAGRLIRLFGGAIDAMVRAREDDRDPFDVLDEEIGWDRLVASREEIRSNRRRGWESFRQSLRNLDRLRVPIEVGGHMVGVQVGQRVRDSALVGPRPGLRRAPCSARKSAAAYHGLREGGEPVSLEVCRPQETAPLWQTHFQDSPLS